MIFLDNPFDANNFVGSIEEVAAATETNTAQGREYVVGPNQEFGAETDANENVIARTNTVMGSHSSSLQETKVEKRSKDKAEVKERRSSLKEKNDLSSRRVDETTVRYSANSYEKQSVLMAPSSQLSPEELKENQKLAREESKAGEAQDSSLSTGVKGKTTAQAESPTLTIETIHPDNYADARKVILAWKTVKKETSHGKRRR